MQFYKTWTRACYEAFVTVVERKRVPWQRIRKWCHGNISVPVAHGDTGARRIVRMCETRKRMVGCSRLPGSHGTAAWQTRNVQGTIWTWCKHGQLIHHNHSYTGVVSGLYLRSVQFGAEHVRSGSSCSRVVGEVVVHEGSQT